MDREELEHIRKIIPGMVALPGDKVYEEASQLFKRTLAPSIVVRPESGKDMAAAIRFLGEHKLPFVIKNGGHSNIVYGVPRGVVLIDLSALAAIKIIDAKKGLVQVGGGALAGEVADELGAHGLGLASGDSRVVGIGGLGTGGGLGFLVRKHGALVDSIVSAEVVTANGEAIEANENHHADLFWAIRGGGSNFGVVTRFTFQAHPVRSVSEATISYPLKNAARVITGWRNAMRQAPAELTTILMILPPKADSPASIVIHGCFLGTDKAAEDAYAPFLSLDEPVQHGMHTILYKDVLAGGPPRSTSQLELARNMFLKTFTDEAIGAIAKLCEEGTPPVLQIRHIAGAMNEHPADMTAFSHRDSEVLIYHGTSVAFGATDEEIDAALAAWHTIEAFGTGCYINMSSENTATEIAKAFPPGTLRRLQSIKVQYDPDNIFSVNYNIPPVSS